MRPAALRRRLGPPGLRQPTRSGVSLDLTAADREYLNSRYDSSVPLPPGAAEYLRPDNPRLIELRRAYAALDIPAVQHSQWQADTVADHLDLAFFRGETMIQWHYRELPRATQLKLFLYLSHLEEIDDWGVLSCLHEDGAFGCWTYEYPNRPLVSRDLLDSVGELIFLQRHLSLLDADELRVLDIGAGYGRLAERMAGAVPGLINYCCVDAIPESTFLCEYYMRHRDLMPPVQVVPLSEIEQLTPGSFDLAVNIHSFSECTEAAVEWWLGLLVHLEITTLFAIPNERDGFLSREPDDTRHDLMPLLAKLGFELDVREPVISDPAIRHLLRVEDHFHIFRRQLAGS